MTADDRPFVRLPLTYDECRARFRRSAETAGRPVTSQPIVARGPHDQELTIDVVVLGAEPARRLLVVLSGVHGVEGFIGSALQCDLLERFDPASWPTDLGIVIVHAVNPWGMAWGRRQNESNVDLNRNWKRSHGEPQHNDAYDEIHHLACPDGPTMPEVDELLAQASEIVERKGLAWVRDAITVGQYRHPDGLHYGGSTTEESNRILEAVIEPHLATCDRVLVLDLHTGHGPRAEVTLLSDQSPGSPQDEFFRRSFTGVTVEATADNPSATTGVKSGQIANGIRAAMPDGRAFSTSAEFGTASDLEQLAATYQAQWVHNHGDRRDPGHAAALWAFRCCFTPDDRSWERTAFDRGRSLVDDAVAAVARWEQIDPNEPW